VFLKILGYNQSGPGLYSKIKPDKLNNGPHLRKRFDDDDDDDDNDDDDNDDDDDENNDDYDDDDDDDINDNDLRR
jgi:hypothetical protein